MKLHRHIVRLEAVEQRMRGELFEIERELSNTQRITAKYSGSARLNGIPQRFLTKFLKVRLKDLLEHETVSERDIAWSRAECVSLYVCMYVCICVCECVD